MTIDLAAIGGKLSGFGSALASARAAIVTGAITAALCLPTAYCAGRDHGAARAEASRAIANIKALQLDAVASGAAAEERVADVLRIDNHEEELIDAIAEIPDSAPGPVRVALGCQRLRDQGTPEADLAAVCGP